MIGTVVLSMNVPVNVCLVNIKVVVCFIRKLLTGSHLIPPCV